MFDFDRKECTMLCIFNRYDAVHIVFDDHLGHIKPDARTLLSVVWS